MKFINQNTMTTTLREEYIQLVGKKPYWGWNDEKTLVKMDDYRRENNIPEDVEVGNLPENVPKESSIESQNKSRHEQLESLKRQKIMKQLINIQPVMIGEEPFAIIDNDYVPWTQAEIIMLEKIKKELDVLIEEKKLILN